MLAVRSLHRSYALSVLHGRRDASEVRPTRFIGAAKEVVEVHHNLVVELVTASPDGRHSGADEQQSVLTNLNDESGDETERREDAAPR